MSSHVERVVRVKVIVWTGDSMRFVVLGADWRFDCRRDGAVSRYPFFPQRVAWRRGPQYRERNLNSRQGTTHVHIEFSGAVSHLTETFRKVWKYIRANQQLRMPDAIWWRYNLRRLFRCATNETDRRAASACHNMRTLVSSWKTPTAAFVVCMLAFDLDPIIEETVRRLLFEELAAHPSLGSKICSYLSVWCMGNWLHESWERKPSLSTKLHATWFELAEFCA